VRVDVPLVCLNYGLREPSSSKPYEIRPIENYVEDPAVIAVVQAYANGDLPTGAAQAAVWHLNSEVSWDELAAKLTGTERNLVRESYFSSEEIEAGMAIANEAQQATAGEKIEPRPFKLGADKVREVTESADEEASPGDESADEDASKGESTEEQAKSEDAEAESADEAAESTEGGAEADSAEADAAQGA
jgi:hypothetical protein